MNGDRLARDAEGLAAIGEKLTAAGVRVYCPDGEIDLAPPILMVISVWQHGTDHVIGKVPVPPLFHGQRKCGIIKEPHTPDRESCSFRQEGDVAMSSLEEKKSELERVLGVFQNYIEVSELLDVVYSKKFGYVLLGLPAADSIDDSNVTRLEDPETLVKEIYQNLAYDLWSRKGTARITRKQPIWKSELCGNG